VFVVSDIDDSFTVTVLLNEKETTLEISEKSCDEVEPSASTPVTRAATASVGVSCPLSTDFLAHNVATKSSTEPGHPG